MSAASVVMESPPVNSLYPETVCNSKDKPCVGMQNGQCHMTFAASVNTADGCYLDTGPTTPLLSGRHSDDSEDDDGADASEELSSDSPTSSVLLKLDGTSVSEETSLRIALQVFFPYLIAGFGMVGAGAVLEIVKVMSVILSQLMPLYTIHKCVSFISFNLSVLLFFMPW